MNNFKEEPYLVATFSVNFFFCLLEDLGSRLHASLSVSGFQCKAIATKSSILDIADVPDAPLITIFGKEIVILFNLIDIYGRS